jgi:hypothetical protein
MKERTVDLERTGLPHYESAKVTQPCERAPDCPAPFVAPQDAPILRRRAMAVRAMRCGQEDAPPLQRLAQPVAVVAFDGNHPQRFLTGTASAMPPAYADRVSG